MLIAVVNESTMVSNADVATMCKAIQIQLDLHAFPAWNMKGGTITFYPDKSKVPGHSWMVHILDNPTVAGALGYHSEDNGKVDAFIFCQPVLSNGGVVLYDPHNPQNVSVSSVLSHEVLEMVGDKFADFWADGPTITQGSEYALELCDPVEGDSYSIMVGTTHVSVSNFVFPSWFNQQASSDNFPFDYLKKLTKPFSMTAGGYMIVRHTGRVSQVFAEGMPEWKMALKLEKRAAKLNRR